MKQREAERQQPRRHAGGQDRQEIPGGMRAAMHLGGEALEMLLDEEEAQELVVGERDRDEPGRRDHEEKNRSGNDAHLTDQAPVSLDQYVKSNRALRQDNHHQSLAHYRYIASRAELEQLIESQSK